MKLPLLQRFWVVLSASYVAATMIAGQAQALTNYTDFGFYRVAATSPKIVLGNPKANAEFSLAEINLAVEKRASIIVLPELGITGYSVEDLFHSEDLLRRSNQAVHWLAAKTAQVKALIFVGAPYRTFDGRLYNVAFALHGGKIIGAVPKTHLPNYNEFYERRWFIPSNGIEMDVVDPLLGEFHLGTKQLFRIGEAVIGVEICEDLWSPIPPSSYHSLAGANIIVNLSASNELVAKADFRRALVAQHAARLNVGYVYASAGPWESTKDVVFGGHLIVSENGSQLAESDRFNLEGSRIVADVDVQKLLHERAKNTTFGNQSKYDPSYKIHSLDVRAFLETLERKYSPSPFLPHESETNARASEILSIQSTGLARRLLSSKSKTMVIGVSGGLDSTLALLVAAETAKILSWPASSILGITMPGMGTSKGTKKAAHELMDALQVTHMEIPIGASVAQHFTDIGHDPSEHNFVYENSQARERTQILFDMANKHNGIVVGTGDLSELCLGWCTYNGDHMSNYGVNASVPKTLVKHLVNWYADTRSLQNEDLTWVLKKILSTEISPELLPPDANGNIAQSTESLVGPYRLHDFFIYHHLRSGFSKEKIYNLAKLTFEGEYDRKEIHKWLNVFFKRFYSQQWKRTTLPSGPKVGSLSISPRGDLRLADEIVDDCEGTFRK